MRNLTSAVATLFVTMIGSAQDFPVSASTPKNCDGVLNSTVSKWKAAGAGITSINLPIEDLRRNGGLAHLTLPDDLIKPYITTDQKFDN